MFNLRKPDFSQISHNCVSHIIIQINKYEKRKEGLVIF